MLGEEHYGCTGSDKFWLSGKYHPVAVNSIYPEFVDVPQWDGIHDRTSLLHWPKE